MESSKSVIDSINSNKTQFSKSTSNTIRITIDLSKKDENGCAVFNYQELVKAEKERLRTLNVQKDQNGLSDLLQNEDEETLKKIALHYEEKYGGGSNMRYQTYTELGAGYDENDSFIDNTEACEEGMQDDTEPKRGSYYVNMGKLEFKKVKNYLDGKKVKKRRNLERISENVEELDVKRARYEKTEQLIDEPDNKNLSTKNYSDSKKNSKNKKVFKEKSLEEGADAIENSAQIEVKSETGNNEKDSQLIIEEKISEKTQQIKVENVNAKVENDSGDTAAAVTNSETSNSEGVEVFHKDEPPKLPEISSELNVIIYELKNLASQSSQRKHFNERSNTLFYRLQCLCLKELNRSGRHAVYSHLAYYLPFPKSTLISKIKELFASKEHLESISTRDAESYKLAYTPTIAKDASSNPSLNINELILNNSKKSNEDMEEEIVNGKTGNANEQRQIKDVKQKGDEPRRMSPVNTTMIKENENRPIVMKITHKKQKSSRKESSRRHHHHQDHKTNDERKLEKDRQTTEKCVTKFCSADEKVQMQLDQVMQDLVVLNQMSSDKTTTNK